MYYILCIIYSSVLWDSSYKSHHGDEKMTSPPLMDTGQSNKSVHVIDFSIPPPPMGYKRLAK